MCTLNKVVLLKKDLPETRLATWIIFQIELVKTVKCTLISMHVQEINIEVIPMRE